MKTNFSRFPAEWAVCALLALGLTVSAQTVSDDQLVKACTNLQEEPLSQEALQTLLAASRPAGKVSPPDLRARCMAAYSLVLLTRGDTNAFERAVAILHASTPDLDQFLTVKSSDAFVPCPDCAGTGTRFVTCPFCMGTGTGKDKRVCAKCKGAKRIAAICPTCKGAKQIFQPDKKIRTNYLALLSDIIDRCNDNLRFAAAFQDASRQKDTTQRIAALETLLRTFSRRPDLAAAKALLDQTAQQRDQMEAQRREREEREQENREVDRIRRLGGTKDLNAAIATVDAFLQTHPHTQAASDLRTLRNEWAARRDRSNLLHKILCAILALTGFLFLMSLLKPLLFRKQVETTGPLPGMEDLDKEDFTDPLTLNAQDSRTRNGKKTTRIPVPDKDDDVTRSAYSRRS